MKGLFVVLFFGLVLIPEMGYAVGRTWYQRAHHGGDARHRVTAFSIGNKGYLGGGHVNSGVLITYSDYWEYDPATNTWTQIADYGGGQRYHSSAFTIGNAAYVGGSRMPTSSAMIAMTTSNSISVNPCRRAAQWPVDVVWTVVVILGSRSPRAAARDCRPTHASLAHVRAMKAPRMSEVDERSAKVC